MFIVDRIEEDLAVLEELGEDGIPKTKPIPLAWLPEDIREGDVLYKHKDGYVIDEEQTQKRRAEAAALLDELRAD